MTKPKKKAKLSWAKADRAWAKAKAQEKARTKASLKKEKADWADYVFGNLK